MKVQGRTYNFSIWGGAFEIENMAAVQSFTLGGLGGMLPPKILVTLCSEGRLWCILRRTEKHTELLEKMLIIIIIIAC